MRFRNVSRFWIKTSLLLAVLAAGATAHAQETIIGLDFSNGLFKFDSSTFGQVRSLNETVGSITLIKGLPKDLMQNKTP